MSFANNPRKRNGISPPYSNAQMAAWLALLLTLVEFGVVVTPILPMEVAIPLAVVFALLTVGVLYNGIQTQSIDPIDPHLVRYWKETHQYEQAFPKQGRCSAALYKYYNRNTLQFQQSQNNNGTDPERPSTALPDELMKQCWICDTQVADHSMHCKFCNKCVYRFDHHCMWLNTCVGKANYKYFVRLLWFLSSLELTHFVVQVYLVIDSFQKGPTKRRAGAWFGEIPINAILLFFIIFSGISAFTLGQLLVFHLKLQRKGLTTYQFIVNDHATKREKAKLDGDREAKRARMIASASRKGYRLEILSLQCGGACRQMGCPACDSIQDETSDQQQEQSNDDNSNENQNGNHRDSTGTTATQQTTKNVTPQSTAPTYLPYEQQQKQQREKDSTRKESNGDATAKVNTEQRGVGSGTKESTTNSTSGASPRKTTSSARPSTTVSSSHEGVNGEEANLKTDIKFVSVSANSKAKEKQPAGNGTVSSSNAKEKGQADTATAERAPGSAEAATSSPSRRGDSKKDADEVSTATSATSHRSAPTTTSRKRVEEDKTTIGQQENEEEDLSDIYFT